MNTFKTATITASLVGLALGAALVGSIAAADPSAAPTVDQAQSAPIVNTDAPTAPETTTPTTAPSAPATAPEESVATPDPSSNWTPEPTPSETTTTEPTPTSDPTTDAPIVCAPWMEPGWANTSCIWAMPNAGGTLQLKACAEEDSQNCYWDATQRGNGQGRSFINIRGHIFYEDAE